MTARQMTLIYGNAPVPNTTLWSGEQAIFLARDSTVPGHTAICNNNAQGDGIPIFGKPHMQRQRQAIANGLCDLCGKPLKNRTKVSLSHARERIGAEGLCIMQVEPLLHKTCAAISIQHCPSLKRDIRNGKLFVRMVTRYRVQFAQLTGAATEEFVKKRCPGAVGHAKIELLAWTEKSAGWLE